MFIVLEGIDGAGCGTQAEKLKERVKGLFLMYPDYTHPTGKIIQDFLNGRISLQKDILFCLFALNQIKDREKIKSASKIGLVVSDRYFTSNLAYNCDEKFTVEKGLKFAEIFDVPKPDLIILLDISPEIAIKRKRREKEFLDVNERDLEKLNTVRKNYLNLAKNNVFGDWMVINGEKSIEEVSEKIWNILKEKIENP